MSITTSQITGDDVGDVTLLMQEITDRSEANTWAIAKAEWDLDSIEYADEYGNEHCLCGHNILEMCWLKNRLNGNLALVGNVCVKRFTGIRSDLVFDGLRRIISDNCNAMNGVLAEFAYEHGMISRKKYLFIDDTCRKRKLSVRQLQWRRAINNKVYLATRVKRHVVPVTWGKPKPATLGWQ